MQTTKKITDDITLGFDWQGGPYIEVCLGQAFTHPYDVINVWDYEAGKAGIPFTREALREAVNDWVAEYPKANLARDVRENWCYY